MPSSTFTPTDVVDLSSEKEWAVRLGMLDWDATSIVFTKRTLMEFLKYTGTTVDPNFANIAKLPRYAQFGKMSGAKDGADQLTEESSASDSFKPSRRVRSVPGGPHTDIFDNSGENEGDALSLAPPRPEGMEPHVAPAVAAPPPPPPDDDESGINFSSSVKPSRRVRTVPGGPSQLSNFWDAPDDAEEFKPTRRVRQGPGGQDNVAGIF